MKELTSFLLRRKYELLLFALLQHLYIGIFLQDFDFYTQYIWPVNMVILGVSSFGIFAEKGRWKNYIRIILFLIVLILPISMPFFSELPVFMQALSILYVVFFGFIFWEIIVFLIKPSYVNVDIISASACGYFLLVEMSAFLLRVLFYNNPTALNNVSTASPAATFIDLVYFSTIVQTTIGFGDITPGTPNLKLIVSFLGVSSQFYSVVLVGILISKFSSGSTKK